MPSDKSKKPDNKPSQKQAKDKRTTYESARMERRVDTSLPWDKDWQKKSRVEVPPSDKPLPENPLLRLKPPSQSEKEQGDKGNSKQ